jgi:NADPH2:quinone reductase
MATRDELMSRMRDIFEWLATGQLKIRIGHVFSMADARRAHEALEARRTTGKVLLTM